VSKQRKQVMFWLDPPHVEKLARLARESRMSQVGVFRTLLDMADTKMVLEPIGHLVLKGHGRQTLQQTKGREP